MQLLHCPHTALRSCGIAEVAGVTCVQNEGFSKHDLSPKYKLPSKIKDSTVTSSTQSTTATTRTTTTTSTIVDPSFGNTNTKINFVAKIFPKYTVYKFLACDFFKIPTSVDITWSSWGPWSTCTKSCGGGRSERQRSCAGGSGCSGDGTQTKLCNSNTCPGVFHLIRRSFRIIFLLQLKSTGPIGDLGMAAVRAAAEEDPAEGALA